MITIYHWWGMNSVPIHSVDVEIREEGKSLTAGGIIEERSESPKP